MSEPKTAVDVALHQAVLPAATHADRCGQWVRMAEQTIKRKRSLLAFLEGLLEAEVEEREICAVEALSLGGSSGARTADLVKFGSDGRRAQQAKGRIDATAEQQAHPKPAAVGPLPPASRSISFMASSKVALNAASISGSCQQGRCRTSLSHHSTMVHKGNLAMLW